MPEAQTKAYWILAWDGADEVPVGAQVAALGARIVALGEGEVFEGGYRTRQLVAEWPSFEAAFAATEGAAWEAVASTLPAGAFDLVVAEGYDGGQPAAAPSGAGPFGIWIGRVDIAAPERYPAYVAANAAPFAAYGAFFLVRGGHHVLRHGTGRAGHVVIAFPDVASARACYHSPGYQVAAGIRKAAATTDLVLVSGVA